MDCYSGAGDQSITVSAVIELMFLSVRMTAGALERMAVDPTELSHHRCESVRTSEWSFARTIHPRRFGL